MWDVDEISASREADADDVYGGVEFEVKKHTPMAFIDDTE